MIKNFKNKIKNQFSYFLLKEEQDGEKENFNKPCPEDSASYYSRFSYSWITDLIYKGYFNEPLEMNDIYQLPESLKVNNLIKLFDNIDFNKGYKYPLIYHIYKEITLKNKGAIIFEILTVIFSITSPLFLQFFIEYVEKPKDEKSIIIGLLLCFSLFFSSFSFASVMELFYWYGMKSNIDVRGGLTAKIYEKTLKLSNYSKVKYNSGSIMNLMSVDTESIAEYYWTHHLDVFIHPIQITILLIFLCYVLGWCGLVAFGVLIVALPINTYFCSKSSDYLESSLKYTDKRVNFTSELITGIRILKQYAYEKLFTNKIEEQRKLELNYLYKRLIFWIFDNMMIQGTSALVLVITLSVYTLSGHTLTLNIAFTSITILLNIRKPLIMWPEDIYRLLGLIPSCKRIEKFLQTSELQDQPFLNSTNNSNCDINIKNATFKWSESNNMDDVSDDDDEEDLMDDNSDSDEEIDNIKLISTLKPKEKEKEINNNDDDSYVLNNIQFNAPGGKLTMICGVVGSGKTSLISGLIGEIYRVDGSVQVPSNLSFTTQQPFLLSASLRDNILFGKEMDMDRYKKVIEACCLTSDLLQLSGKDLTEIGERGINLSGGQKQRISLARALYADSDCYILDEPLGAVDSVVSSHLFDHCIQGMMSNKTRILVTHQIQFIKSADHIVVIDKDGSVIQGTYDQLQSKGIDFDSITESKNSLLKENVDENQFKDVENDIDLNDEIKEINIDDVVSDKHEPDLVEKAKLLVNEDKNVGAIEFDVYKQYFQYGASSFFIVATGLTFIISQCIFQFSEYWLSLWSSKSFEGKGDTFYIGYYLLIVGVFIGLLLVRFLALAKISFTAGKNLHNSLLSSISLASCHFFDTNPSGRILNRFSKDINQLDAHILESFSEVLLCLSAFVIGMLSVIYFSPWNAIPLLILSVIYYILQKIYRASGRELNRWDSITLSPIFSLLQETYNGLVSIRTYKQQEKFIEMMHQNININIACFFYSCAVFRWVGIRLEFLGSLVIFFASFFSMFYTSNNGYAVLAVTTALSVTGYLNWAVLMIVDLELKMNSFERVNSYINTPPEGNHYLPSDDYLTDWPSNGLVEFKNVELKYPTSQKPSLNDLSFVVESKEKIGICGRTGAGKSTVVVSLFRMVECSKGSIFIDGIDISTIGLQKLRSSIGIVPQDPLVYSGSIRMNLDPFNQFTDDQIWEALEKVKLKDSISSMPMKLYSKLKEGGNSLSYGERQLLCLCRVVLKKYKIIFLDESTSGIDYATASLLKTVCDNEFKNCTMLTIAHRLDTIIDSDKIAVIDQGQLIEFDSPMNLIKNQDSKFKKLVKHQLNK